MFTHMIQLLLIIALASAGEFFLNKTYTTGEIFISGPEKTIFYWLFPNENKQTDAPLFLWFQGGPACNSDYLAVDEMGPYKLNADGTLKDNPYSWTKLVDVAFIDNPIGTGWSLCNDINRLPYTEEQISMDLYTFLVGFLDKNPQYKKRPLYLSSQSYGGHYIPNFASYIINKKNSDINLKGITLGNALISPTVQLPTSGDFAYQQNLINWNMYQTARNGYANCVWSINAMMYSQAASYCSGTFLYITGQPYRFNIMDIRKSCINYPNCYDYSNFANFLNKSQMPVELNMTGRSFIGCNAYTQEKLLAMDYFLDYRKGLETALANDIPVFLYYGNKDFVCPSAGGLQVAELLNWKGQDSFSREAVKDYMLNGTKAGTYKQYSSLFFATVFDAGHRVPYDQPQWAFDFLKTVVLGKNSSITE